MRESTPRDEQRVDGETRAFLAGADVCVSLAILLTLDILLLSAFFAFGNSFLVASDFHPSLYKR